MLSSVDDSGYMKNHLWAVILIIGLGVPDCVEITLSTTATAFHVPVKCLWDFPHAK